MLGNRTPPPPPPQSWNSIPMSSCRSIAVYRLFSCFHSLVDEWILWFSFNIDESYWFLYMLQGNVHLKEHACKVVCHEIGHLYGIRHCAFFECLMNGSNRLITGDRQAPLLLLPRVSQQAVLTISNVWRSLGSFHWSKYVYLSDIVNFFIGLYM